MAKAPVLFVLQSISFLFSNSADILELIRKEARCTAGPNMMIQLIVLKRTNMARNTVEIMVHHTIIMDHVILLAAVALVSALKPSKTLRFI